MFKKTFNINTLPVYKSGIMALALLVLTGVNAIAASHKHHDHDHGHDEDKHDVHEHDAHVHGIAELMIGQEGNRIDIRLESPSANIVGFEHEASTSKQKQTVKQAKRVLQSAEKLFLFVGTTCKLEDADVDVSALIGDHDHHDDHDKHHHGEHDDETHSEVEASYQFTCDKAQSLTAINVELFSAFPGIETLNVSWITAAGQGGAKLKASAKRVSFR